VTNWQQYENLHREKSINGRFVSFHTFFTLCLRPEAGKAGTTGGNYLGVSKLPSGNAGFEPTTSGSGGRSISIFTSYSGLSLVE
jgi:hypothetical protein